MTQLFVTRAELIPEGETTEDHRKWQQEEAAIIERDKSNTDRRTGGLFRGCFGSQRLHSGPIIDDADGVTRCPVCAWEIEDGVCQQCSLAFGSDGEVYSVEEFSESEGPSFDSDIESASSSAETAWRAERRAALGADDGDDGDISLDGNGHSVHTFDDMADGEFAFGRAAAQGLLGRPIRRPSHSNAPADRRRSYARSMLSDVAMTHTDSAAEESDSEDEPESLDGFIVNDEDQDQEPPSTYTFVGDPHESSGHDGWDDGGDVYFEGHNFVDTDEDDSDEGGAISNGRRRRHMRSSSSIPDDNTGSNGGAGLGDDSSDSDEEQGISRVVLEEGWSPLHQDATGVTPDAESRKSHNGRSPAYPVDLQSDSDSSALPQRHRRRRRQLSELSYGDDSDHDNSADQIVRPRRQSSSGTVTIGRGSLGPESTSSSSPRSSRQAQHPRAPIIITSSPARQVVGLERQFQHRSGRRARSQSNDTPEQSTQTRYSNATRHREDQRLFGEALVRALGRSIGPSVTPEDPRRGPSPQIHSSPQESLRATRPTVARLRARQRSDTPSDRAGPTRRHPENTGTEHQSERRRYKERRRQQRGRATSTSNQGLTSSWEDPDEDPRPPVRRGERLEHGTIEEEQEDSDDNDLDNYANDPPWSVRQRPLR